MAFPILQQKDWNADLEVTAANNLTNTAIIAGDGGGKGIKSTLATIDANGSINIPTGQYYKINGTALAYTNITNALGSAAVLTDNAIVRGDGGARGVQTSGVFVDDSNNITGVNSLTLGSTLTIANDIWFRFANYAGTGYLNALKGTTSDELELGTPLNSGTIEAEEDAGVITFFDMPVSDAPTAGDEMSATFKIDANNVFKIGAKADGSGSIDSQFIQSYGAIFRHITVVNAATYDLLPSDDILNVTYTATGVVTSLTLPTAQCVEGRTIVIKDAGGGAGTYNITVDTEGDETIDGAATAVISSNYDSITLYSDGSDWFII